MGKRHFWMKKIIILLGMISCSQFLWAQGPIKQVLKNYFRANPFDIRFSSFILSLQQDPWLTIQEISRRTDSTFFYLAGTYKNFNPFHFTPEETRLIIAEDEYLHNDSLNTLDTIIIIQMMGISGSNPENQKASIKEFNRFHKTYNSGFSFFSSNKMDQDGQLTAEIFNYFILPYATAPLSIAWGKIPDTGKFTFTVTLRCKVKENIADLVLAPGELH
jgi:hypothetical protein